MAKFHFLNGQGPSEEPQTQRPISFSAHTHILSANRTPITITRSWFFILLLFLFFQTSQNCIVGQGKVTRLFFQRRMKIFTWNTYKAQLLLKEIQTLNWYSVLCFKTSVRNAAFMLYDKSREHCGPSQESGQLKVTHCTEAQAFKARAVNDPSVT